MIRAYHQPTALPEALTLVARGAIPLAGGTALYTARTRAPLEVVDLGRLGLGGIEVQKRRVVLGATVTMTELERAGEIPGVPGALLRRAARALGSRALRNSITLGGNVVHVAYWADMPVVLLALGAELEVRRGRRRPELVAAAEALAPGEAPWKGGLLTRVVVPLPAGTWGSGYERLARTSNDYALATVCVVVRHERGALRDARVVVGALQGRPFRLPEVESMLEGQAPSAELAAAAAERVGTLARVAPNFRTTAEWRRKVVEVLARRAIEAAASAVEE